MNSLAYISVGVILMAAMVSVVSIKRYNTPRPVTCVFTWSGAGMNLPTNKPKPKPEIKGFDVSQIIKGME